MSGEQPAVPSGADTANAEQGLCPPGGPAGRLRDEAGAAAQDTQRPRAEEGTGLPAGVTGVTPGSPALRPLSGSARAGGSPDPFP